MATNEGQAPTGRVPRAQLLLDDIVLLLLAGLVVPTVFYLVWGVISILSVPAGPR